MPELSPEQWAEIRSLFEQSSALPPEARAAFLAEKCANPDVLGEVRSLLEHSSAGFEKLDAEIAAEAAAVVREADPDERLIGVHLGPYKVEAIVGHGGMGAVYRAARDDAEFHQQVAIKLVRAAAQSPETLQRFKQERQILARLAHPNIARLLDGGSTRDGVPYLVMEFIEGEIITAWSRQHSLSIEQCLRLFLQVCEGVAFAHDHLVVHRDLKPGNILVTADGTPKLLDFGIAKMLAPDTIEAVAATLGTRILTPEYAAPEQVSGDPISKAVDVYALGLILYEILTGRKAQKIPDPSPGTVARVVCRMEPVRPVALRPALAGDLDNIIRMAIRKDPQRRYGSAADLALDIRLYLEKRPVAARADTMAYRASKFLKRNRAAVAGVLIMAVVWVALAWWLAPSRRVPRVLRVVQLTQTGHADFGGGLATDGSYVYFVERAPGQGNIARVPVDGGTAQPLPNSLPFPQVLDLSPDRTNLLVDSGVGLDVPLWAVPTNGSAPRRIADASGHTGAWSPDGQRIVFGKGNALFMVNNDGSGLHKLLERPSPIDHVRWAPAPSPTVLRYDAVLGPGTWSMWEVQSDGAHPHLLLPNWERGALHREDSGNWISGGRYYVFRATRGDINSLWALKESRGVLGLPAPDPVLIHSAPTGVFWPTPSLDGKRVFFISGQGRREFLRYDAKRREFMPFLMGKSGRWISFSKDGQWVAYTGPPQDTLWRSRSDGSDTQQLISPSVHVYEPKWSPDGAWIIFSALYAGQDWSTYAIPSAGGTPQRLTPAASNRPAWSPDGSSVLLHIDSAPADRGLYVMDWKTRKLTVLPQSQNLVWGAWSPDARYIAATDGSQFQVFDIRAQRWTLVAKSTLTGPPFWSKDGKYIYFQDQFQSEQPIFRVPVGGGKLERMMSSAQIPQSDLATYLLVCLDPNDTPIVSIGRNNSEIYALDLDLP